MNSMCKFNKLQCFAEEHPLAKSLLGMERTKYEKFKRILQRKSQFLFAFLKT